MPPSTIRAARIRTATTRTARRCASARTAAALVSVPLLLLGATTSAVTSASADDKVPPAVSIALTDGVETVASGTRLVYTVTVRNEGAADLADLRLEQQLPSGSTATMAGQQAKVTGGRAVWAADVSGHGTTVLTSSATLGSERDGVLRAASTACAYLSGSTVPVVCSSDMDMLPTGAEAEVVELAETAGEAAALGMDPTVVIGAAAGAALIAGGGALVLRRRRKATGYLG